MTARRVFGTIQAYMNHVTTRRQDRVSQLSISRALMRMPSVRNCDVVYRCDNLRNCANTLVWRLFSFLVTLYKKDHKIRVVFKEKMRN